MMPTKETSITSSDRAPPKADPSRELLWTLCHDLLNQLSIIRVHAQAALVPARPGAVTTEAEWAKAMSEIDQVALSAVALMEDILRAERGNARVVPGGMVDFEEVLSEVLAIHVATLSRAGCRVMVARDHGTDRILGVWNRAALERLVSNLLQNVARHAPGAPVTIQFGLEPGWLHITFSDRGRGLSGATTELGRTAFVDQAADSSQHGLGLWIIHRSVETMNGLIEMQNEPGSGLTFDIRLPMPT
jgi:signal transduction histidine kinase